MCFYLLKCEKFHFSGCFLIKYLSIRKTQDPAVCRWLLCCKLVIKLLWCNVLYHAIIPSLIEMCRMILLYYILHVKLSICLILFLCYTSCRAFALQMYDNACDIYIVRRSAHPRGAFLCNRNEVSYCTKNNCPANRAVIK